MRWIVISLFLLNLGYFAWEYSQTKPAPPVTGVSASLPPLPGKRLVLLTERLPAADSAVPPPAPPRSSPVPEPRPENVDSVAGRKAVMCLSVGPYETAEQGNNLVASLAREGVEADLEQLELAQDSQYWVVLPPAASRKDALENLRKLQAKKIDSYLMAAGEMKNAISLGLFNKEASARGVLARVREAGFGAEIIPKPRIQSEYWVRIPPQQPLENAEESLATLVPPEGPVKISKAACEMFAQTR